MCEHVHYELCTLCACDPSLRNLWTLRVVCVRSKSKKSMHSVRCVRAVQVQEIYALCSLCACNPSPRNLRTVFAVCVRSKSKKSVNSVRSVRAIQVQEVWTLRAVCVRSKLTSLILCAVLRAPCHPAHRSAEKHGYSKGLWTRWLSPLWVK